MAYTLPSGTTAVPGQKILSARYNAAMTSIAAALNARRESTELLPKTVGGFGVDVSAVIGLPHFYNGTVGWESGTVLVDALGADPTGVADSSAAVQSAIDGNYRRVLFNPSGTYKFTTAVTIPLIATDTRREVDGQRCTIVGANGIANCFKVSAPTGADQHNYLQFHGFVFDGTVTGAFVKVETGATWWHDYWDLTTTGNGDATATALLEFHNTSAAANPGGFTARGLKAPSNTVDHTILFSKEAAALGDFDDFHLDWLQGGDDSTVEVEDGCTVVQSDIRNILSDSHGIRTVGTGTVQNSHISRIYVEPSITPSYGTTGWFIGCIIEDVRGWMAEAFVEHDPGTGLAIAPFTIKNQFKAAYGTYTDCTFRNCGMWSTDCAGPPWALATYRLFDILAGGNVIFEFPAKYAQNAILTETSSTTVYPVSFVAEPVPLLQNTTDTLQSWMAYNTILTNYGQGVPATITLPAAKAGMRFMVIMQGAGQVYHLKPNAADKVYLNGTALDDGDKVSNAVTVKGNMIRFETFVSGYTEGSDYDYDWIATTVSGTWVDGGA